MKRESTDNCRNRSAEPDQGNAVNGKRMGKDGEEEGKTEEERKHRLSQKTHSLERDRDDAVKGGGGG